MRTVVLAAAVLALASPGFAQTAPTLVSVVLKDHVFTPSEITVPAGQPIRIELKNQDGAQEEFDSDDLHDVEKVVAPHGKAVIEIKPLKPGVYRFVGELHAKTAKGTITAQ